MAFNKDAYQELYEHIQTLNNYLTTTTQSSLRIETKRRQRGLAGTKHSVRLKRAREHARNIHQSITRGCWKCACDHRVMLRMRPASKESDLFPSSWKLNISESRVSSKWHVLELHPQEEPDKENQPPVFQAVCGNGKNSIKWQNTDDVCSVSTWQGKPKKSVKWQATDDSSSISVVQVQMAGISLTNIRIEDMCSALSAPSRDLGFLEAKDDHTWRCSVQY